jgi:16S rRNA (uracil1498-N3)-methyltransferase
MALFYIDKQSIHGKDFRISGPLGRHLRDSLRCRPGERIQVVDQNRRKYHLVLTHLNPREVRGEIVEEEAGPDENGVEILLGQGLPKGKKMEVVLQKATELGVASILPLITERTVVRLREDRLSHDMERWRTIVTEAAQQSERWSPPEILKPSTLSAFLEHPPPFDLGLLLWEKEKKQGLGSLIRKQGPRKRVVLLVGPEGGFTEREVQAAVGRGFISVSLGQRILRTETAGPYLVGLLQYEWGDIGE